AWESASVSRREGGLHLSSGLSAAESVGEEADLGRHEAADARTWHAGRLSFLHCSPRLRRGVVLRGTASLVMVADPRAEPNSVRNISRSGLLSLFEGVRRRVRVGCSRRFFGGCLAEAQRDCSRRGRSRGLVLLGASASFGGGTPVDFALPLAFAKDGQNVFDRAAAGEAQEREEVLARAAARVEVHQHRGDDDDVELGLDALAGRAEQVIEVPKALEPAEEELDLPALPVQEADRRG